MNDIQVTQEANGETDSPTQAELEQMRWTQTKPWLPEGQADDRTPMNGSVKNIGVPPPVQRAFGRRSHQVMFKKWSQARHD